MDRRHQYADTAYHIQDRHDLSLLWDRGQFGGRWQGTDAQHTWVHALGVPLDAPWPPYVPLAIRSAYSTPSHAYPVPQRERGFAEGGYTPQRQYREPTQGMQTPPPPQRPAPQYEPDWRTAERGRYIAPRSDNSGDTYNRYAYTPAPPQRRRSLSPPPRWRRDDSPSTRGSTLSRGSSQRRPGSPSRRQRSRSRSPYRRSRSRSPIRYARGQRGRRVHSHGPMGTSTARSEWRKRDDEAHLREKALHSRPSWVRTIWPEDITKVATDDDGHPICPLEVKADDEDDYGSDSGNTVLPSNWVARETERVTEALELEMQGTVYNKTAVPMPATAGIWANLPLRTVEQAANVLRWVTRTEPTAFAFMHHHVVRLGNDPTVQRSAPFVYLMAKQVDATTQFWMRSTGRRHAPPRPSKTNARRLDPPGADPIMVAAGFKGNPIQVYVGNAVMGDDTTTVIIKQAPEASQVQSGTHTKRHIAVLIYGNILVKHWPHGLRVTEKRFPHPAADYAEPYDIDVGVWFTINALCPRRTCHGSSVQRVKFFSLLMLLLSVHGTFHRYAQFGQYPYATLPLEHYPFRTENITMSLIVSWFVQHGIAKDGEAIAQMESFARARRNWRNGVDDPTITIFTKGEFPRNPNDVLAIPESDITPWADIRHAPPQDGVRTAYPECPSTDAMDQDEDHAPSGSTA
ncbi:hypothetical protein B0H11DRAFT_2242605 [Mycena galericulata]|nr:hypothetical protein B0H11DRAFT_2242605 [Mycena galericulata]